MSPQRNPSRRNPRRGQVLVFIVAAAGLFLSLAALAVDMIYAYTVKVRLVTAVDACALGAARSIGLGQAEMNRVVDLLFDSNFPSGFMLSTQRSHSIPVITSPSPGVRQVQLRGDATVPTFFMRWAGYDSLPIAASALAARRDVNLLLILDRSGSMKRAPGGNPGPTAFDDLKAAALDFVNRFDDTTDRVGMVSFGSGSHLDHTPATGFKTGLPGKISSLYSDNSGTNTSDGLARGVAALQTLNDPDSLNFIVFFTDGVSTHYSGNFRTNTNPPGSGCDNKSKLGVIGTYSSPGSDFALGLTVVDPGAPPVFSDQDDWISGCGFGSADVRNSIPRLEMTDSWGTSVMGYNTIPYWSSGKPTTRGLNIKPIAENLTANHAAAARQNATLPITLYSIGMGGDPSAYPADHDLMRMVANDPAASSYDDQQPTGLYVYAPTPLQLQQAFQRVAREIFRLIQ
jgi:hypothetical protein